MLEDLGNVLGRKKRIAICLKHDKMFTSTRKIIEHLEKDHDEWKFVEEDEPLDLGGDK